MTSAEPESAGAPPLPPVNPVGWLVPTALLVCLVSLALPWFEPNASKGRVRDDLATLHAWQDGLIFIVSPVALAIASAVTVALLIGRPFGRFQDSGEPARSAGLFVIAVGLLAALCDGIQWLLVPSQFPFWNAAAAFYKARGVTLVRGPQFGYFLDLAAAALALVAGIAMVLTSRARVDEAAP